MARSRTTALAWPGSTAHEPSFFSGQTSQARRFWLDLTPPARAKLSVVSGGCEHCRPDYQITRSGFRYFSIEFVAGGEGTLVLGSRSRRLQPGDVFTYGPRVAHDIRSAPDRPLVKYFVDFTGVAAAGLLRDATLPPGSHAHTSEPQEVLRLFEDLLNTASRATDNTPRLCALILEQMTLRLGEMVVEPEVATTQAFETYQRCRNEIESHASAAQNLRTIAKRCRVAPSYLCRLFQRFDRQSPHEFLQRRLMLRAAERLQEPGAMVRTVADELGFKDAFTFSRAFRRVMGVPPSNYLRPNGGPR